ncbi:GGDEF domain-containing protein [Legionella worsleiensis]|uniref:GGDEF/EAL domain-containing sensory box protein n=1 Tax=Legionella worsleiensis TaxID=45076 RepID=A0A0W1AFS0_9GAMM|nr:GGDEF domain-containing protein [Legionella worsleiensis]KTD80186.1 GGDEF/EAL domain-containing sensory box protein [Legionella worsleiensis]STY31774.1 sensory box protein, EAL domain, GGDEF domain, signal transduction protein [Legionella worsleiensis]
MGSNKKRRNTQRAKLPLPSEQDRKYRLLTAITIELLIIGVNFTALNLYLHFWAIACLLFCACLITAGNWVLLKKKWSITLCSHIINILCLLVITIGNLFIGGVSSSNFGWFYLPPLLAATTLGLEGLILYSMLSAAIASMFLYQFTSPIYQIPPEYLPYVEMSNHVFIFLLISTVLYNLLKENKHYETVLKEQNFLLHSDKQKFHYLSNHDSLTNLPNRPYFNTHLQNILDAALATQDSVTLFFMDLDEFKKINDKYGHDTGDILLLQVGKRLKNCFREQDFIARLGGDEFTAIIRYKSNETLVDTIIKRVNQEFTQPFCIKHHHLTCSISIGTANFPDEATNAERLLNLADNNMYQNKKMRSQCNKQDQ